VCVQVAFDQDKHEDVLNHCVAQFEPDSAEFKNVSFFVVPDRHIYKEIKCWQCSTSA